MKSPSIETSFLKSPRIKALFAEMYGQETKTVQDQIARYQRLLHKFKKLFAEGDIQWFSAPGRTELSGNHTDHNYGRVLAASIDLDCVAATVKTTGPMINVYSEGFPHVFSIDTTDCRIKPAEIGTTAALVRGIAARFKELGFRVGGFNACIDSNVMVGSGLSSSASFEVLIGTILNALYNGNRIKPEIIATIGQYAENNYFGKPCGLMDQMASAVGGIIAIDFNNPLKPLIEKVPFDIDKHDYRLLVVDTGGSHADLTDDYASIPSEMRSVAAFFGKKVCREISTEDLAGSIRELRSKAGDRAILRASHFLTENKRVVLQKKALQQGDLHGFLKLVNDSGESSYKWLQNCYSTKNPGEQGVALALMFTRWYLESIKQGACRVHGGGFAGTIQVFLPRKNLKGYATFMENIFKEKSVVSLRIRPYGSIHLNSWVE